MVDSWSCIILSDKLYGMNMLKLLFFLLKIMYSTLTLENC